MQIVKQTLKQLRETLPLLVLTIAAVLILVFILVLTSKLMHFDLEKLTRDPAIIADCHPFIGFVSNLGIILWTSAAVVCLLGAAVQRQAGNRKLTIFFVASGFFSAILMFDDLFMLHDWLLPVYFSIDETMVYIGYLLLMGGYLVFFYKTLLEQEFTILGFAGVFLGASMAADMVMPQTDMVYFYEDSLKFLGVLLWFLFFARTSYYSIKERIR